MILNNNCEIGIFIDILLKKKLKNWNYWNSDNFKDGYEIYINV